MTKVIRDTVEQDTSSPLNTATDGPFSQSTDVIPSPPNYDPLDQANVGPCTLPNELTVEERVYVGASFHMTENIIYKWLGGGYLLGLQHS